MTVPNFELIAEVLLLSEGFTTARELGTKLVSLFSLSKQLLSLSSIMTGALALKTVLGILAAAQRCSCSWYCGRCHRGSARHSSHSRHHPPETHFRGRSQFADLFNDVYPGVKVSDVSDAELETAIKEVLSEKHYEA